MKNEEHDDSRLSVIGVTYCTVQYVHSAQYRLTNLNENLIPSSVFRALAASAAATVLNSPSLSLLSLLCLLCLLCLAPHLFFTSNNL